MEQNESEKRKLKSQELFKSYGSKSVVQGVSLEVEQGEIVGLLGPNGAGKTTSFYMTLGLVAPDKGSVYFGKQEITRHSMAERARLGVGYLPQEPSIFRTMTVEENLLVALEASSFPRREWRGRLKRIYAEFQISGITQSIGKSLSGGERRRVEIARALIGEPKFLLLDEPFAGIDPIAVNEIQKIIVSLKDKGLGVLITDHNVRETLGICDRAYLLKSGKVILEGNPESILRSPIAIENYLGTKFKM